MLVEKIAKHVAAIIICLVGLTHCSFSQAQVQDSSEGYIETSDGLRLFYRVDGPGDNPVVVLHGGPGLSMSYLRADLLGLSKYRTLIFYDQRGSGRSTITTDPSLLSVEKHIGDLDMLRRHFRQQKLTLLGHSWGSGLAALYAIKYPAHVNEMLLVAPMEVRSVPYTKQFLDKQFSWMDKNTQRRFSELLAIQDKDKGQDWCREFFSLLLHGYFSDSSKMNQMHGDICDDPQEALLNGSRVEALVTQELGDWDWRNSLKDVQARTLVVYGSDDIFPLESAREWAASLPNVRLMVIPESGHLPHIEQPILFFNAVKDFLSGRWPTHSAAVNIGSTK